LRAIPVFFTWAALTIIFIVVPNTTVGLGSSAVGALFASVGWEAVKVGFNYYVIYAVNFSKIYGSLSVIPIFIMGIYLLWVVVFAGAEIAYVLDNYKYHEEWADNEEAGFKPFLAIGVMLEICGRFYYGEKPAKLNDLAKRFRVSLPLVREVINGLIRGGLITRIGNDNFQPAKDLHLITVEEIIDSTIEKCAVIKRNGSAVRRIMQLMHPESASKLEEVLSSVEDEHHIKLGGLTLLELMRLKEKKEEPLGAV
jgi:membrane protein